MVTAPVSRWFAQAAEDFLSLGAIPPDVPRMVVRRDALNPVTFSVLGGALFSICQEMDITLRNTSLSPWLDIWEGFSCPDLPSEGQLVAEEVYCPGHVV